MNTFKAYFIFIASVLVMGCGSKEEKTLQVDAFQEQLNQHPDAVLIDVRTPEEVAQGMIPGAINIDYKAGDFVARIDALDKSKTYYVYCAAGIRSEKAATIMVAHGFDHVKTLAGGINAWKEHNKQIVN